VRLNPLFKGKFPPSDLVTVTTSTSLMLRNTVRLLLTSQGYFWFQQNAKTMMRYQSYCLNSIILFPSTSSLLPVALCTILPLQFSRARRNALRLTDRWYCGATGTTELFRIVSLSIIRTVSRYASLMQRMTMVILVEKMITMMMRVIMIDCKRSHFAKFLIVQLLFNLTSLLLQLCLTIIELCLTVIELCLTIIQLCLTIIELCLTIIELCLTVIQLCLTIIELYLTIIELCLTIIELCLTVIELCLTIIELCLTIIELCLTIIELCLTVFELCLTVIQLCLTIILLYLTIIQRGKIGGLA
jgi:hypothetical protein